jgi:hypothetical protein
MMEDQEDPDPGNPLGFICCCPSLKIQHNETLKFKLMGNVDFDKIFLFENRFDGELQ